MGRLRMNRNVFEALNVQARILKTLFEIPRRSRSQNYFDVYFCSFELHTFETLPPSVDFLSFSISAFLDTRERENRTLRESESGAFKQVRRFTDESRIWNGASAVPGLSRPYRIEWLRSNGVTTAPKRGSKLRSDRKKLANLPDGGAGFYGNGWKKLFLSFVRDIKSITIDPYHAKIWKTDMGRMGGRASLDEVQTTFRLVFSGDNLNSNVTN